MKDLSTRAQQAKPEEARGLLAELADLMPLDWPGHSERWAEFHGYLHINTPEAHLAAAMMLVPEGAGWSIHMPSTPDPDNPPHARVWGKWTGTFHGDAATPALALIAAVAQAIETRGQ